MRLSYLDDVRALVQPGGDVYIGGELDMHRHLVSIALSTPLCPAHAEYKRDWGSFRTWSNTVFNARARGERGRTASVWPNCSAAICSPTLRVLDADPKEVWMDEASDTREVSIELLLNIEFESSGPP